MRRMLPHALLLVVLSGAAPTCFSQTNPNLQTYFQDYIGLSDDQKEDLRQHFLVQLNGQYEGQATGETFNFDGKTDILVLDQLFGYVSWRDTKIALLIFNRDRNLTTVLQKIPELVKAHPNFRKQQEYNSESAFRFLLHHKDDNARDLILTVHVFEVPA